MDNECSMTCLAPTVAAILALPTPAQATGQPISEIVEALKPAERLAQLCPDALGTFPFAQCRDHMPFLSGLHDQNSVRLRAVMPTITPVNFATMIAGADKSVHGIGAFSDEMQCETLAWDSPAGRARSCWGVTPTSGAAPTAMMTLTWKPWRCRSPATSCLSI